jgi:zinc transport system substrate-binding protein
MRIVVMNRALPVALAALVAAGGLAACDGGGADPADGRMAVSASFYPLQWAAEQVGGDHVVVTGLTPPGGEPHDLELTPKAVGRLARADVVVYLAGFQPAVDDAVAQEARDAAFDVSGVADLSISASADGHVHPGEATPEHAGHAGTADPHFWLDPVRFEKVATAIGERFAAADPPHAADYRARAGRLVADLSALDRAYRAGLADCAQHDLVTAHTAFAYLAQRYGLSQEGIAGISPDVEPDAATLRDLAQLVRSHGVTTVYTETLASPALAETVARETGATVAVLDPVEGLTSSSAGRDYLEVMRSNLATLEVGQQCR